MAVGKCPKCGSVDIDIGSISAHAKGCSYVSAKGSLWTPASCLFKSYLCLTCGYIELYADEALEKFKERLIK